LEDIRKVHEVCTALIHQINGKRGTVMKRHRVTFREPIVNIDALLQTITGGAPRGMGTGGHPAGVAAMDELITVMHEEIAVDEYLKE
jgi:hypothetical protein